ncbi:hypothetical protein MUGA111182_19405 [Mucilaginibacter galii]|uniref:Uncharacterized protein n=1 Tax=Mucilaginibacter galii TaxID=2005073 RepID=A0A917JE21_9SPHI|nr:hypothetical protein [Mucilaginibacter galii]GGI52740.1 hypothetical protein GCM10011425_39520 [Mucilaginibacter galii]
MDVKDLFDENDRIRIDSDEKLEVYMEAHYDRFHNLLLWANVAILINFVMIIVRTINLYKGDDPTALTSLKIIFAVIFGAFAGFLVWQWRAGVTLGPPEWGRIKTLLQYKVGIMEKQIGLIIGYITAYTLILVAGYAFYETTELVPVQKVIDINSPVTLVMYLMGSYSLYQCFNRRQKLLTGINAMDEEDI